MWSFSTDQRPKNSPLTSHWQLPQTTVTIAIDVDVKAENWTAHSQASLSIIVEKWNIDIGNNYSYYDNLEVKLATETFGKMIQGSSSNAALAFPHIRQVQPIDQYAKVESEDMKIQQQKFTFLPTKAWDPADKHLFVATFVTCDEFEKIHFWCLGLPVERDLSHRKIVEGR